MNEQNMSQEQNSIRIWLIVIAVVITALVVGGVVYALQSSRLKLSEQFFQQQITLLQNQIDQLQQTQQTQNQQNTKSTTVQNNESTTPSFNDETASWKNYTNSKLGFEVKYPGNWKITEHDNGIGLMAIGGQDVSLGFFVYDSPLNEAEALLPLFSVPGRNIDSRTNVTLNGIDWVKLIVKKNQVAQLTYHNEKTYAAQYSTFENISPKIISTFRFTK